MPGHGRLLDPDVQRHLLASEGEQVIEEVRKHWASYGRAALELAVAAVLLGAVVGSLSWLPLVLALLVGGHGALLALQQQNDRFVITNMRVFRVSGVLRRHLYTMPLIRILDITVDQPLTGRLLGYGHFVFESAADSQGLRVIRFVGDPTRRDLTIQRTISQAGLRRQAF